MSEERMALMADKWMRGEVGDGWLARLAPSTLARLWWYVTERTIADFKPRIEALEAAMDAKGVEVPVRFSCP